jgi:surface protein
MYLLMQANLILIYPIGIYQRLFTIRGFVYNTKKFNTDVSKWDTSKIGWFDSMFENAQAFTGTGIENWMTADGLTFSYMFRGATKLNANLSLGDMSWATNVSNVEDMSHMFERSSKFNGNVTNWNVSNVIDMNNIFVQTQSFEGIGLQTWWPIITNNASSMILSNNMFCNAIALNGSMYLYNWDPLILNETTTCADDI